MHFDGEGVADPAPGGLTVVESGCLVQPTNQVGRDAGNLEQAWDGLTLVQVGFHFEQRIVHQRQCVAVFAANL